MCSHSVIAIWTTVLALVADCRIIDLTHPLAANTIYWPGVPSFNRTIVQAGGVGSNNVWIEVGAFSTGEHGGTHIDVPRHFNISGYDLNDLPIELTIADGVMIDVKDEVAKNNDYALTVQKIQEWENQHGAIPNNAAVMVNTGWSSRWPNSQLFFNSNTTTNQSHCWGQNTLFSLFTLCVLFFVLYQKFGIKTLDITFTCVPPPPPPPPTPPPPPLCTSFVEFLVSEADTKKNCEGKRWVVIGDVETTEVAAGETLAPYIFS
ncbi:unnamed protein product [Candidula unifasciata]|uniref:Cyclase n=1 Tax=Candidula unifasciata TaxID=100452 RepID=A0A8S3YK71_9EUPU|nr:unnamed protein product [Candidula unifasciata]